MGQPFWLAEQGLVRYLVLRENLSCDVVIVGGVISGAMLQYELDENLADLRKQVGIQRANDAYLANLYGVRGVARLCQHELPHDCGLRYCHSLYLASKLAEVAVVEQEGDARPCLGIGNEFLREAELLQRFGLKSPAALYSADTAEVDPYALTHTLLREAQTSGLQAFERTKALRYEVQPDGQRITRCTPSPAPPCRPAISWFAPVSPRPTLCRRTL